MSNQEVPESEHEKHKPKKEEEGKQLNFVELYKSIRETPLVMNKQIFEGIQEFAMCLLPKHRNVVLCFEHFYCTTICPDFEKQNKLTAKGSLPEHCLVLNVKFMSFKCDQFIGNVCYYSASNRQTVAQALKAFIDDLFICGLKVTCTVSSGRYDLLLILDEFHMVPYENAWTYRVGNHVPIIHMLDSSWLMRKLRGKFENNNIAFHFGYNERVASFCDIATVLKQPVFSSIFCGPDYKRGAKSTKAAIKLFSESIGNTISESVQKELSLHNGTSIFAKIIDKLFDTFNTTDDATIGIRKLLRYPVTSDSFHWKVWDNAEKVLKTMKFVALENEQEENSIIVIESGKNCGKKKNFRKNKAIRDDHILAASRAVPTDYEYILETVDTETEQEIKMATMCQKLLKKMKTVTDNQTANNAVDDIFAKCKDLLVKGCNFEIVKYVIAKTLDDQTHKSVNIFDVSIFTKQVLKKLAFLDVEVFDLWRHSTHAIKAICDRLIQHHLAEIHTKTINCDSIHQFVNLLQKSSGQSCQYLVNPLRISGCLDEDLYILAFEPCGNVVVGDEVNLP